MSEMLAVQIEIVVGTYIDTVFFDTLSLNILDISEFESRMHLSKDDQSRQSSCNQSVYC